MTRDFLIECDNNDDATLAQRHLEGLTVSTDGLPLFGSIDNRGSSLFVTLTYPNEVQERSVVVGSTTPIHLMQHVVFVAIKNGMHAAHGYLYCRGAIARFAPPDGSHVSNLHSTVMRYFGIDPERVSN